MTMRLSALCLLLLPAWSAASTVSVRIVMNNWGSTRHTDNFEISVALARDPAAVEADRTYSLKVKDTGISGFESDFSIEGQLPQGALKLFMNNYGRNKHEDDFKVTGEFCGMEVDFEMDNQGRTGYQNDFSVKGKVPEGEIAMEMKNSGKSKWENDFKVSGKVGDLKLELEIDNTGNTRYENDFRLKGSFGGEPVDLFMDDTGKDKYESDYDITGHAPLAFVESPAFFPMVLAIIKVSKVPIYEESAKATDR